MLARLFALLGAGAMPDLVLVTPDTEEFGCGRVFRSKNGDKLEPRVTRTTRMDWGAYASCDAEL